MSTMAKYKGAAGLVVLLIVAPFVVWQHIANGTVNRWHKTGEYRRQISELRAAQSQNPIAAVDDREMILSGLIITQFLPVIESECLKIDHFSSCVSSEEDGVRAVTGQLVLEGGFIGIVRALDNFEHSFPEVKLISAHYRAARRNSRRSSNTLRCTVYFQQITTT